MLLFTTDHEANNNLLFAEMYQVLSDYARKKFKRTQPSQHRWWKNIDPMKGQRPQRRENP